ncbi:hypothetical protein [Fretibacter rubidus]|uniref:hypothetical protein n=1 Tax=Fretibacter rubidus TaxID=570162 RepID=UPI00352B23FB
MRNLSLSLISVFAFTVAASVHSQTNDDIVQVIEAPAIDDNMRPWGLFTMTWRLLRNNTQTGTRKKAGQQTVVLEIIQVPSLEQPGQMALACVDGQMQMALTWSDMMPADIYREPFTKSGTRTAKVDVFVNGEKQEREKWSYKKKNKALYALNTRPAMEFYNHIILRNKVEVSYKGETHQVIMPEPNATFANWGADCGVGLNAKR